jgi:hypothetical protein
VEGGDGDGDAAAAVPEGRVNGREGVVAAHEKGGHADRNVGNRELAARPLPAGAVLRSVAEHGAQQLGELFPVIERIADAVILARERRQVRRRVLQRQRHRVRIDENGNERISPVPGRPAERGAHLAVNPVDDALRADHHRKGCRLLDEPFKFFLPDAARREIVPVDKDLKAGRPSIGQSQEPELQFLRRLHVDAGMAEKQDRATGHRNARIQQM